MKKRGLLALNPPSPHGFLVIFKVYDNRDYLSINMATLPPDTTRHVMSRPPEVPRAVVVDERYTW